MNVPNYMKNYRFFIIVIVTFSTIFTFISIILPFLNGRFVDLIIGSTDLNEVIKFAMLIISLGLFGVLAAYVNNMALVKLANRSTLDLISNTIGHIQRMPYDIFVSRFNPAYLVQRINNDAYAVTTFIINNFAMVFLQAGSFIAIMYIMATINTQVFLLILVFMPAYVLCYMLLRKPLYQKNMRLKEDQNHLSKVLFEQMSQIHVIKAEASFDNSIRIEKRGFEKYMDSLVKFNRVSYLFTSLDGIIAVVFQAIVLLIGGIQIVNGKMTLGEFTIVSTYFAMLIASLKYYFNLGRAYQEYKASYSRMDEIYSIDVENNGSVKLDSINNIILDKVTYSYPNQDMPIIREMSARFNKGDIVLITGKNGAGKSTMMNVIMGILQNIQDGNIKYDGIGISDIDLYSLRNERMATLLQNSRCPDVTVREYLSDYFALDEMGIVSLIGIMGLQETFLGDNFDLSKFWDKRMEALSGGERQKIMLIKALGKGKDIVVLDEPSTGLDVKTMNDITDYLDVTRKSRICIIISHDSIFERISNSIINFERNNIK